MPEIKILSDTHNQHEAFSYESLECDILIHCGDATNKGNFTEVETFYKWFVKTPAKYKLFIPGNHDRKAKEHPLLLEMADTFGILNPHNNLLELMGLRIWGNWTVPRINYMNGKMTPGKIKMQHIWSKMPEKLDILVTHVPPYKILDEAKYKKEAFKDLSINHLGCPHLLKAIEVKQPKIHVFGHTHEKGMHTAYSDTCDVTFMNCAALNRDHSEFNSLVPFTLNL